MAFGEKATLLVISNKSALPFPIRLSERVADSHQFRPSKTEFIDTCFISEPSFSLSLFSVQPRQYVRPHRQGRQVYNSPFFPFFVVLFNPTADTTRSPEGHVVAVRVLDTHAACNPFGPSTRRGFGRASRRSVCSGSALHMCVGRQSVRRASPLRRPLPSTPRLPLCLNPPSSRPSNVVVWLVSTRPAPPHGMRPHPQPRADLESRLIGLRRPIV